MFWLQYCIQLLDRLHLGSLHVSSSHSTLAHRYLAETKMDVLHSALSRGMSRYNWTLSPVLWPTQTRYLSATCLLYVEIKIIISSTNGLWYMQICVVHWYHGYPSCAISSGELSSGLAGFRRVIGSTGGTGDSLSYTIVSVDQCTILPMLAYAALLDIWPVSSTKDRQPRGAMRCILTSLPISPQTR